MLWPTRVPVLDPIDDAVQEQEDNAYLARMGAHTVVLDSDGFVGTRPTDDHFTAPYTATLQ